MTITVVQSKAIVNATSGALNSATTAKNTLVALVFAYATTNVTLTAAAMTLGGSADNFALAAHIQSGFASSDTQILGAWVDPECAGGQTTLAATVTNGIMTGGGGIIAYELAGCAVNPLDTGFTSTGTGTSGTAMSSGTSGGTVQAGELIIGAAYPDNGIASESGSFTNLALSTIAAAGYATESAQGSTLAYTATATATGVWAALEIALRPSAGGLLVASLFP